MIAPSGIGRFVRFFKRLSTIRGCNKTRLHQLAQLSLSYLIILLSTNFIFPVKTAEKSTDRTRNEGCQRIKYIFYNTALNLHFRPGTVIIYLFFYVLTRSHVLCLHYLIFSISNIDYKISSRGKIFLLHCYTFVRISLRKLKMYTLILFTKTISIKNSLTTRKTEEFSH